MKPLILAVSFALCVTLPVSAFAEASAQLQLAGLRAPEDPNVNGFRFVLLFGQNDSVKGLDLGFANFSEQKTFSGFSFIFGISKTTVSSSGCACAFVNLHEGSDTGLNAAFINAVKTIDKGLNLGFVNITEGYSSVDIGGLSMAKKAKTQLGFVNFTEHIDNIQIGFLNFAENGFMPFFPIVNYPKKN